MFTLCIMYNVDNIVLLWTSFASLLGVQSFLAVGVEGLFIRTLFYSNCSLCTTGKFSELWCIRNIFPLARLVVRVDYGCSKRATNGPMVGCLQATNHLHQPDLTTLNNLICRVK